MIKIKNLNKHFKDRIIFENLNLELPNIGLVAILGDSGSGKTTLLNMLSGIDFDYEGSIEIDYQNLKRIKKKDVGLYRLKNIGFVFQNFSTVLTLESTSSPLSITVTLYPCFDNS